MFSFLTTVKSWLYTGIGFLVTALVLALAFFVNSRGRWKDKAVQRQAQLKRKAEIESADSEIDAEYSDRERIAAEDKKDGKVPAHLRNNSDW